MILLDVRNVICEVKAIRDMAACRKYFIISTTISIWMTILCLLTILPSYSLLCLTVSSHWNLDIPQILQSQHQGLFTFPHFHIVLPFLTLVIDITTYPAVSARIFRVIRSSYLLSYCLFYDFSYEQPTNWHLIMTKSCHSMINIPQT